MTNLRKRLSEGERKAQIMRAAMALSERHGYTEITRQQIAKRASCSPGLVSNYYGDMPAVRKAIMRAAIEGRRFKVILQGLSRNDPTAKRAPASVKTAALASLK